MRATLLRPAPSDGFTKFFELMFIFLRGRKALRQAIEADCKRGGENGEELGAAPGEYPNRMLRFTLTQQAIGSTGLYRSRVAKPPRTTSWPAEREGFEKPQGRKWLRAVHLFAVGAILFGTFWLGPWVNGMESLKREAFRLITTMTANAMRASINPGP